MRIFTNFIHSLFEEKIRLDPELTDKPITIFYDYIPNDISELNHNPYNFLFIQEPNQFFGYHDWTIKYGNYFNVILTWSQPIIDKHPDRTLFFPFAAGWYDMPDKYHTNKRFEVSFLCGNKQMIEGHLLRHRIYNNQNKIKIPNHFIYTAPWDGGKNRCWESMYHIAIENSRNMGYFTEKIIDCFISKTIPIYCGCPNIDEFFNKDGIITFNNEVELIDILNNLTPEYYLSKKDVIEENYKKAVKNADFLDRINLVIKEICKLNNI